MALHIAPTQAPAQSSRSLPVVVVAAVLVGLVGGVVTVVGENATPSMFYSVFHSLSWWTVITVAVGAALRGQRRLAALAGLVTQLGLVAGYYLFLPVMTVSAFNTRNFVAYTVVALVTGPVWGAAGACLRVPADLTRRVSLGLVSGPFLIDGVREAASVSGDPYDRTELVVKAVLFLALAVFLPAVIGRSRRDWLVAMATAAAMFSLVTALYQGRF